MSALSNSYPQATSFQKESIYLSKKELKKLNEIANQGYKPGISFKKRFFKRYLAMKQNRLVGYAYLDTHIVRTLYETVLIIIDLKGKISRIQILNFKEPLEYKPSERWLKQYQGRKNPHKLTLQREIVAITGASFTTRSLNRAVKKILILHRYLLRKQP